MKARGYASMMLINTLVVASMIAFGVTVSRQQIDLNSRKDARIRHQALWLARSAVLSGQLGTESVQTPLGVAKVVTARISSRIRSTVSLSSTRAVIEFQPDAVGDSRWTERFDFIP